MGGGVVTENVLMCNGKTCTGGPAAPSPALVGVAPSPTSLPPVAAPTHPCAYFTFSQMPGKAKAKQPLSNTPKRPQKKADTKIVLFDTSQRHFIYMIVNPETGRVIYIGRTIDLVRRGAEHNRKSSACKQLRATLELATTGWKLSDPGVLQIVPELPFGVPGDKAQDFESYFICEYDTLYHPVRNITGCNLKHGDNVTNADFEALKRELEEGVHSKPPKDEKEASLNLMKSIANESMLADIVEEVGDMDAELSTALTQATMTRIQLERACKAPLNLAVELAKSYESKSPYEEVDREEFQRDLNQLRDKLTAEEQVDAEMLSALRAISLFGKSNASKQWEMRANVAASAFRMAVGAIQAQEEAKLDKANVVIQKMLDVRGWTVDNGGMKKPVAQASSRQKKKTVNVQDEKEEEEEEERSRIEALKVETSLGSFLDHWKATTRYGGCKRPFELECNVIMLNVAWWAEYSNPQTKEEKTREVSIHTNKALVNGFATPKELNQTDDDYKQRNGPNGPLKLLPSGGNDTSTMTYKVYKKINSLLDGHCNEDDVRLVLKSLPKERFDFYFTRWSKNRSNCIETKKQRGENRQKRAHASGTIKPRAKPNNKKQKVGPTSSSSSSSPGTSSKFVSTHRETDDDDSDDEDSDEEMDEEMDEEKKEDSDSDSDSD